MKKKENFDVVGMCVAFMFQKYILPGNNYRSFT
jgi:hypothetical protein